MKPFGPGVLFSHRLLDTQTLIGVVFSLWIMLSPVINCDAFEGTGSKKGKDHYCNDPDIIMKGSKL